MANDRLGPRAAHAAVAKQASYGTVYTARGGLTEPPRKAKRYQRRGKQRDRHPNA